MTFTDKTILITGANRGIGQALVQQALQLDAKRVYATTRYPHVHDDPRVTNVVLDVTDGDQIEAAAGAIDELDLLINNAGYASPDDFSDRAVFEQHLAVNLYGPFAMIRAFTPVLSRSRGAVVNVLSVAALAAIPMIPSYSLSKAAAFSMSQSLRPVLARDGVTVHVALLGPVDTEMSRELPVPKASPESVARAILDGVENGDDEIFPDALSATLADGWRSGPVKELERQNAAFLPIVPAEL